MSQQESDRGLQTVLHVKRLVFDESDTWELSALEGRLTKQLIYHFTLLRQGLG